MNVNLAPVADVARPGSVMSGRAYTGDAEAVAASTAAAVRGLRDAGVAATPKHFPGLGGSAVNTDDASAGVAGELDQDLIPYRSAIEADAPLVMVSHALYPALDGGAIASQSEAIVTGLLQGRAGLRGRGRDRQPGGPGRARSLGRGHRGRALGAGRRGPDPHDRLGQLERRVSSPAGRGEKRSGLPRAGAGERRARDAAEGGSCASRPRCARAPAPSARGAPSACRPAGAPTSRRGAAPRRRCRRRSSA